MPHQMDVTVLNFTGTQYLYHVTRLVPTEIIVIVLVKELGKSVLFWIIRKVPTLVLEIPNTTFSHKLYKPWSSRTEGLHRNLI